MSSCLFCGSFLHFSSCHSTAVRWLRWSQHTCLAIADAVRESKDVAKVAAVSHSLFRGSTVGVMNSIQPSHRSEWHWKNIFSFYYFSAPRLNDTHSTQFPVFKFKEISVLGKVKTTSRRPQHTNAWSLERWQRQAKKKLYSLKVSLLEWLQKNVLFLLCGAGSSKTIIVVCWLCTLHEKSAVAAPDCGSRAQISSE